ncbi:predicted protein [Uncinocarpus reesii 1704]|uniref:Helicase C-terminal domain-containing protein n=1 Tax=Uncinocarpus reesii (strain UAMH 1704) TaxID=336963 RepID=C4JDH7_UNCRE|nr:uncharacterized protein UREG_00703 [Uncinocarpus reesii 1704]EEP75856.1 predicted protein [Uncinocarpus reesii 1704]
MVRDGEGILCSCSSSGQEFTFYQSLPALYNNILERQNHPVQISGNETSITDQEENDWISLAGHLMPSAKLTAIQSCVANWLTNSPGTKVTIFTQFRGMVRILSNMCIKQGWGHTTLTGNAPPSERHRDIEEFRVDPTVRVLISSLKAGGTGLNLTMADKCILVDLWWNEAIEQQAFCRLFRYGQTKEVEIVRISVKNSIDDRIQLIQHEKSTSIEKTIGYDALSSRDTLEDILKIFGVTEDPDGENGFAFIADDDA